MHAFRLPGSSAALAVLIACAACGTAQSSTSSSSGGGGGNQATQQTCGGLAAPAEGGLLTSSEVLNAFGGSGLTVTPNKISESTPPAFSGCRFEVKDSGGQTFAGVATELFQDSSIFDDTRVGKYGATQTVPVNGVADAAYYVLDPNGYDAFLYAKRSGKTFEIHVILVPGSIDQHEAIEKQLAVIAAGRL